MGREIRRVPPNWEHPESERPSGHIGLQPMYDQTYEDAAREWRDGFIKWYSGEGKSREDYKNDDGSYQDYWEYEGSPPGRAYYRPWKDDEATWFQLWETVSEGTPTSPPFETEQALADYLSANGDFWDQERCKKPDWKTLWGGEPGVSGWGKQRAERFVFGGGWAPSMIVTDGKVISNPGEILESIAK